MMSFSRSIAISVSVLFSLHLMASAKQSVSPKVIYGEDDRVEPYQFEDKAMFKVSRAVAAMIDASAISNMPSDPTTTSPSRSWGGNSVKTPLETLITLKAPTLEARGMCKSERFFNQITAANCSGFLVGEDLLVTAGHCVEDMDDCRNRKWVFGYEMNENGKLAELKDSNVYDCKAIVGRALTATNNGDFAVLRLSRKVVGIEPMKLNLKGHPEVGDELVVLGHPTGLPQKIAGGAHVKALDNNYFYANLDTYGGNSGSAVVNLRTHEVEGILVRGLTDYIRPNSGSTCLVSNVLSDDTEKPEEISFIGQTFEALGIAP